MRTFNAKLLKDLSYITNCKLKPGATVQVTQMDNRTHWIIDPHSNQLIKLFQHEFQLV